MKKPTLSLCIIAKNEEKNLERCFNSVKEIVDEIILIDTGSTDKTIEIGKQLGAKVYSFKWCDDFAAARNFSIEKATGDWILSLHADEVINENQKEEIPKLLENEKIDGYYLIRRNYSKKTDLYNWYNDLKIKDNIKYPGFTVSSVVRLFRNKPEYKYRYRVHEMIYLSIKEHNGKIEKSKIQIIHFNHKDISTLKNYERIIKSELKTRPDDEKIWYDLAQVYRDKKEANKAIMAFEKVIELNPSFKSPQSNIADIYQEQGKIKEAIDYYKKAIKIKPGNHNTLNNLGVLLSKINKPEIAEKMFRKAIRLHPRNLTFLNNLSNSLIKQNKLEEAEKILIFLIKKDPKNKIYNKKLEYINGIKK